MCAYTETGNIKCSLSKIHETTTQIQENQKENRRETQPKHKKKTKEKQRETQGNRFDYKSGLLCLPEKYPKPKHTKTGFILKPILAFSAISQPFLFCFFCI